MKRLDFHVHILNDIPVEKTIENYTDMCERKGYDAVCIQALLHCEKPTPDNNRDALEIKAKKPEWYIFGSIDRQSGESYAAQAKRLKEQGFDGIKILGGKPSEYRIFGYGYEDEKYDELFAYCEEEQFPLMIHNNDPKIHWDISKASARAIEKGWVYDETLPSQEFFFLALEGAFARHPKLRAAVAHMGFYSDNLDRASALLDLYPNLYFDITPALIIYSQLSETPEKSKAFFNKYSDRLIYGTDADNDLTGHAREYNDTKTEVIKWFLEGNEPKNVCGYDITPVCLNAEKLADIYYNNAMRFMGKSH